MADPKTAVSLTTLITNAPLVGALLVGIYYGVRELRSIIRDFAEERLQTAERHTAVIDKIVDKSETSQNRQVAALEANTEKLAELNIGCVQTREAMARATQAMENNNAK
ncbi:MAG: hypothetical protein ACTSX8_10990 [Alphaproteobacteria bacterium]